MRSGMTQLRGRLCHTFGCRPYTTTSFHESTITRPGASVFVTRLRSVYIMVHVPRTLMVALQMHAHRFTTCFGILRSASFRGLRNMTCPDDTLATWNHRSSGAAKSRSWSLFAAFRPHHISYVLPPCTNSMGVVGTCPRSSSSSSCIGFGFGSESPAADISFFSDKQYK